MEIDKKIITKEQLEKAMECKTAEELMALAKSECIATLLLHSIATHC